MERPMKQMMAVCRTERAWLREILAEFLGTFFLVFIGNNSVAQSVLSEEKYGQFLSINFAYGLAVMIGVLVAGAASGAHLNPAVTLSLAVVGKFPFKKVLHYMLAQYLGAFVAAACTFMIYIDALNNFDDGIRQVSGDKGTAGIFATYPQDYLSLGVGFVDQVLGTAVLLAMVSAITDKDNQVVSKGLAPLLVGLVVIVLGNAMGFNCGYAINPARDLAPRIFTAIAGWGSEVFTYMSWSWVPVLAPHVGGLLGAVVYLFFVEMHWPNGINSVKS